MKIPIEDGVQKMETSWVIINKITKKPLLETFNQKIVNALNTEKYTAVPVMEYLVNLNRQIKEQKGG